MGNSMTVPRHSCCNHEHQEIEDLVVPVSAYAHGEEVDKGVRSVSDMFSSESTSAGSANSEDGDAFPAANMPMWKQEVESLNQRWIEAEEERHAEQVRQRGREAMAYAAAVEAEAKKKAEEEAKAASSKEASSSTKKKASSRKSRKGKKPRSEDETAGDKTEDEANSSMHLSLGATTEASAPAEGQGSVADSLPDDLNECTQAQMVSVCKEALTETKAQVSVLYVIDNGFLTVKAHYAKPRYEDFANQCYDFKFAAGVGLPGRTFKSKRPGLLPDVNETDIVNFQRKGFALENRLLCFAVKPLGSNGVLEVVSKKKWDKLPDYMKKFKRAGFPSKSE
eukprot:TRINITY_DN5455_c0_g1_i8.p1 TRINITY_DN5455_c0_g1~~TRINITY_DN5455_c0_g1_i8.p1  ORF type:complete len:353 (-),score=77.93 TRINITY_DN5455_c0_g1_i8:115-1125(-)